MANYNNDRLIELESRLAAAEDLLRKAEQNELMMVEKLDAAERERDEAVALLRYVCSLHPDDCGCSGCKFAFLAKLEAKP